MTVDDESADEAGGSRRRVSQEPKTIRSRCDRSGPRDPRRPVERKVGDVNGSLACDSRPGRSQSAPFLTHMKIRSSGVE